MSPGTMLHSTELLDGSVFEKTVIYIAEYNEKGSMGFVMNQPFPRRLNELEEFKHGKAFPLHLGGPVDREHLYFLHRRPDLIPDGVEAGGNVFLGGDFKTTIRLINNGTLMEHDLKIFLGYCGWDSGELEAEIAEGSWQILEAATLF